MSDHEYLSGENNFKLFKLIMSRIAFIKLLTVPIASMANKTVEKKRGKRPIGPNAGDSDRDGNPRNRYQNIMQKLAIVRALATVDKGAKYLRFLTQPISINGMRMDNVNHFNSHLLSR